MWPKLLKTIDPHPKLTLATLLIFVFLVRLAVAGVILYPDNPESALNTDQWGGIAKNLVDGYGYVGGQGHVKPEEAQPNSERGPVPVLFLAGLFWLFGYNLWAVMVGNWLCDVGTAYVLYRIIREVFPDRPHVAYTSILLWALYIPEVTITNMTYSEPLFTLLLAGHTWTILRLQRRLSWSMASLSGVLLGAAALSRSVILPFLPIAWLLLLLAKGLNKQIFDLNWLKQVVPVSVILSIAFGLTLLPWIVRNYSVFRAFIPGSTLAGYNLIRDNYYLNSGNFIPELVGRTPVATRVEEELQARGETLVGKSPVEVDRLYQQLAFERIRAYPGRYLIVCGYRFLRLWFNLGFGAPPSIASYMVAIANGIFLGLLIAAFLWFRAGWVWSSLPALVMIVYTVVVHVPFHAQVRYIFPVMPYAIMFGSYTVTRVVERVKYLSFSQKALAT